MKRSLKKVRFSGLVELMSTYVCGTTRIHEQAADLAVNTDDLSYVAFSERGAHEERDAGRMNLVRVMKMQAGQSSELPVNAITQIEWENSLSNRMSLFRAVALHKQGKTKDAYNVLTQLLRESPDYGSGEYYFWKLDSKLLQRQ